jgi:hypothetical protein
VAVPLPVDYHGPAGDLGGTRVRLSRSEIYALPLVLLGTGALAYFAYRIVGFLGIGLLGVLIGFIAVRVDLEKEGAVGSELAAGLYAQQMSSRRTAPHAERAAHRAETQALRCPLLIAKIIAAVLVAVGFAGFFYLD